MSMEENKFVIPEIEGEDNLIAAAKQISRALESKKNLTSDARRVLANLGTQLSSISKSNEIKGERITETETVLNAAQEKIMNWEADQSMIWDSSPDEAYEYLNAADETRKLAEKLESWSFNKDDDEYELLNRVHDVLQTAMAKLEEEFKCMLVNNRQPFEPDHMSFRSSFDDTVDMGSIISFGDESIEESLPRDSLSRLSEEFIIDLIHPEAVPDLRCIANLMFKSKYDLECSQAYISARKDALDDCLFILEMEKLSIEDVLKMEWINLNSKIRKWIRAMKIFVRVYLASEKWLSDQIFGELGLFNVVCFVESSKASMLQLLNFCEAMSINSHQPEKLFRILDMYEVLADLLPDIDALYLGVSGSSISIECREILSRLGASVKGTFVEFKNAIASNPSTSSVSGGGIHPLTRYVMNYIRNLTDYSDILNFLFKDFNDANHTSLSPQASLTIREDSEGIDFSGKSFPMACQFTSVASILESNLGAKAKLYKEASLQHLFLMNNIHYMAQKVKGSELRLVFGDEWIRKWNWKFQQEAMNYQRASWSSILYLLKDEGIQTPGSSSVSRVLLKERCRSFCVAFEEIYKTQTAWVIPDVHLRDDLRISTSLTVIQAYRAFVGRHAAHISDKHIKYSADDLEDYLMDLFEGSPKSLQNSCKR